MSNDQDTEVLLGIERARVAELETQLAASQKSHELTLEMLRACQAGQQRLFKWLEELRASNRPG